jgi:hypothetical protein
MLDVTGAPDVETVLSVVSVIDATAAPETPLPLLEAGRDEATTLSELNSKPKFPPTATLDVRVVLIIILDSDLDEVAGAPPAFPIPRPLYR